MRKILSFFTEKKEEAHITVAREAYYQALLVLRSAKKLNTTDIKAHYLRDLMLESLNQLVLFFKEHKDRVTQEGDQKTLETLASQLDSKTSAPDVVQTLKTNLYQIKPGWMGRGFVYQVFVTILSLPIFQSDSLWRSEFNRVMTLEADVDRLKKKTEVLSFGEHRMATVASQHDVQALRSAKSILFADSFKVHTRRLNQEEGRSQEKSPTLTFNSTFLRQRPKKTVPVPAFNLDVRI